MKNDSYKNVFVSRAVAKALLDIKAVGFVPDAPIRFKSGILSPVYLDNRRFPFYPKQWHTIIESFIKLIAEKNTLAVSLLVISKEPYPSPDL